MLRHDSLNPPTLPLAPRGALPARHCPNCAQAFQLLQLAGRNRAVVELDICTHCHLIWFDELESVRLAGGAVLDLLVYMAAAQTSAMQALQTELACVQCGGRLKPAHNIVRHGHSMHLECDHRHGSLQNFALFLAEQGLVRALLPKDLPRDGSTEPLECLNCGASVHYGAHQNCGHCQSPLCVLDVDRVANLIAGKNHQNPSPRPENSAPKLLDSSCGQCGAAVDKARSLQCPQCGAMMATTHLRKAVKALQERLQNQTPAEPQSSDFSIPKADAAQDWRHLDGPTTDWQHLAQLGRQWSRRGGGPQARPYGASYRWIENYMAERPRLDWWWRRSGWLGLAVLVLLMKSC